MLVPVNIQVTKEGVRFSVAGDIGSGNVMLKQGSAVDEKDESSVTINLVKPVDLAFSLKYLNNFTKATSLSDTVTLHLSDEVPLLLEYNVDEIGHIRYYLAPKMDDDEEEQGGAKDEEN